ncbi:MAG: hypothetical protein IPJ37_17270 [Bacteroidales bacterium]|nr:hypothetical protein [Bacteroidales bacterium]
MSTQIESSFSMITEQLKYLGINVILELNEDVPEIFGNKYKFEQVIVNLLVNSQDAVLEKKSLLPDYTDMMIGIKTFRKTVH